MGRKDFKSQFQNAGKTYANAISGKEQEPSNFTEHVAEKLEDPKAAPKAKETAPKKSEQENKPKAVKEQKPQNNKNPKEIKAVNYDNVPSKKTSLSLDKNIANYISINSKLTGINQNKFLCSMLEEKMDVIKDIEPDYMAEKRPRTSEVGTIIRTFEIPMPVFEWMKRQSALRQMSASLFVNDIVLEKMKSEER